MLPAINCFALVNRGLEKLAQKEIKELVKSDAELHPHGLLTFSVSDARQLLLLAYRAQSLRKVAVHIASAPEVAALELSTFAWKDVLPQQFSFRIDVEHVMGQEQRLELARIAAGKLFALLERQLGFKPTLKLKRPEFHLLLYKNEKGYLLGLDLCGEDLTHRSYRLFTHQASLRGDLAYFFVRETGFKPGEKLLAGYGKDGTAVIEAALFSNPALPVHSLSRTSFSLLKFPCLQQVQLKEELERAAGAAAGTKARADGRTIIRSFDENRPNITASRKNALLIGVKEYCDFQRYHLEELDTRYGEEAFERVIFHLTGKDEGKLNELLYQCKYILKRNGILLLFTISEIEVPVPEEFRLVKKGTIARGDNVYRYWKMKKESASEKG